MRPGELVLTVGGPGDRPVPGCRPATPGEGTLDMKRSRPPRPAVWDLPGTGRACTGTNRRAGAMETPPTVISPRPGDGQIRDSTLSLRRPNPGRSQATSAILPGPPSPGFARGSTDEEDAPSLRRTRPTPTPTNTHLRKYRPARWIPRSAGTLRYAPAEPSGSWTRRGNPGGI